MTKAEYTIRILVVDDNAAIHEDFRKILGTIAEDSSLSDSRSAFFGEDPLAMSEDPSFAVDSAYQGDEALEMVRKAQEEGRPYALAFVDVRMPPGWDGIVAIERFWEVDPDLHAVICTAFSDYSWGEIVARLGRSDQLLVLKKPFDPVEARQVATAMTDKWRAARELEYRMMELEDARVRAQEAGRAKAEFLANMSHEIRTPMNAILGYTDLLRDSEMTPVERGGYLDTIERNAEQLLSTLSDILDIVGADAGSLSVDRTLCSPYAILHRAVNMVKSRASASGLELGVRWIGPIPEFVSTDALRLRQILVNLLNNAVKFTDEGSVHVDVRLEQLAGGPCLRFDVVDTGCGIRPEDQERIFEAFSQADGSLTREKGGIGMGLAVSRRFAELLGGNLQVESEPGEGSTFTLRIQPGSLEGVRMLDHSSGAPRVCREGTPARSTG